MTLNRRFFLQSSCGAVVAVAASQLLITKFLSNPQSAHQLVTEILRKRFPAFDFSGDAINLFAASIVEKDSKVAGTSGISLEKVLDKDTRTITFERYVVREFLLNTNYLTHKNVQFKGLQYVPFAV